MQFASNTFEIKPFYIEKVKILQKNLIFGPSKPF